MTDEEESESEVTLGEKTPVDGAPLARVTSRLTWPKAVSEIDDLEGDSVVRTPDGPRELSEILADVDEPYFERRQAFEATVRDVIGPGPVRTAE